MNSIEQFGHLSGEQGVEFVERHTGAMIGDPILWKIVGANLLAAFPGSNLSATFTRALGIRLALFEIEQSRTQNRHRLRFVLVL